jgi:hypothetical protein
MVQMKIKTSALLMEAGVSYNKQKLHKAGYFPGPTPLPCLDASLCAV